MGGQVKKKRRAFGNPHKNIKVDDVVLVFDPDMLRWAWPMSRVVAIPSERDGDVRVAKVATKGGIPKRSIRYICPVYRVTSYTLAAM